MLQAKALRRRFSQFLRAEDGLIMTEFLILLPLLIWTYLALVVFWDAYRTINESQKAAYAVSDLISRQSTITTEYADRMEDLMEGLLGRPNIISMRITSFQWDQSRNRYDVIFSLSPNNRVPPLDRAGLTAQSARIPNMAHGEAFVLVETWTNYRPGFNVGIDLTTFENFIVTKPRYYRRVCLRGTTCPADA